MDQSLRFVFLGCYILEFSGVFVPDGHLNRRSFGECRLGKMNGNRLATPHRILILT